MAEDLPQGVSDAASEDADARRVALDPARSFIVQAPAGSGKTELLIQRFLRLLAVVERPESVVAMTFTRKAAAEMQTRVIEALRDAHGSVPANADHAARTRKLARAVLERDAELGWQLLDHPARLRIQTIDAFCAGIARQAPLASRLGGLPRFEEDARPFYLAAARAALRAARDDRTAWRRLLDHLDNDADRTVGLLAGILARREQWLRHVVAVDPARLRASLEETLAAEIGSELARLAPRIPAVDIPELVALIRYAVPRLPEVNPALASWAERATLPETSAAALTFWQALAQWLLTASGSTFRKRMVTRDGFPPPSGARDGADADARTTHRDAMHALLARFEATPGLGEALDNARHLPPPRYADAQWSFVEALLHILPRLAAQLQLTFAEAGTIDFTHAVIAAHDALGEPDTPSNLLLALDLRIQHLLVDEFQDTSWLQFSLLERLTAGWQEGDGRSLFLVGDPMQSIYRFREAQVSLFLQAQESGIGTVRLEPLRLASNFRAQARLVSWVNEVFARVFPPQDDLARASVAFKASTATREEGCSPAVTFDLCRDDDDEAGGVIERLAAALSASANGSVAILVRARTHLSALLPRLRQSGIPFQAVELEGLHQRQAVVDLVALTHALIQPHDRLAWLACLRAPWCGLRLDDLLRIAERAGKGAVLELLLRDDATLGLSSDGASRVGRLMQALAPLIEDRGRRPLATLVRSAWLALGGPACADATDRAAAERVFSLLEAHAPGADCANWDAFTAALENLRAEPLAGAQARVQVMTLHKAKGLEFDTVILPGLSRVAASREPELLRWKDRPPQQLLLAGLKARATPRDKVDALYEYLDQLIAREEADELTRLLYVGSTRACERLHLLARSSGVQVEDEGSPRRWKPPPSGSALAVLWQAIAPLHPTPESLDLALPAEIPPMGVPLTRLRFDWSLPRAPAATARNPGPPDAATESIAFDWARQSARHIGTVAHRLLRQIADEGLPAWSIARVNGERPRIAFELKALGVAASDVPDATAEVVRALANTLDDPRGRWLFDPAHRSARSEYALSAWQESESKQVVIDRTFVDADDVRWIVDFKLSMHEGQGLDRFLDNERERYRVQLENYGAIFSALGAREVSLALYFPRLRAWRAWRPRS